VFDIAPDVGTVLHDGNIYIHRSVSTDQNDILIIIGNDMRSQTDLDQGRDAIVYEIPEDNNLAFNFSTEVTKVVAAYKEGNDIVAPIGFAESRNVLDIGSRYGCVVNMVYVTVCHSLCHSMRRAALSFGSAGGDAGLGGCSRKGRV
jgi:hypothetical protein